MLIMYEERGLKVRIPMSLEFIIDFYFVIIVVIITETAKLNLKLAALITAMPIVTLLCIFWMYYEGMEKKEISEYVFSTLKYLIPTIPMFVLFPILIERTNFYITVFLCCLAKSLIASSRNKSSFLKSLTDAFN